MTKKLKLVFDDVESLEIHLLDNEVAEIIYKQIKHLQHVPIPQYVGDNPFNANMHNQEWLADTIVMFGNKLGVTVDLSKLTEQSYLNDLHQQYEQKFPVDYRMDWHRFHEIIHVLEEFNQNNKFSKFVIVYNNLGGPLEHKFQRPWIKQFGYTQIHAGDCYVSWNELGKTPHAYWRNNEPADIDRICQLAKPWLLLRPKICVAVSDFISVPSMEGYESFCLWFAPFKDAWCKHWNLIDWTPEEMFQVIKIGTIDNLNVLIDRLRRNIRPNYVKLV